MEKFNKIRRKVKNLSQEIKAAGEVKTKRPYKRWRNEDKVRDLPFRRYSASKNSKPYSVNILRDAYINFAEHPVISDFFKNTEKVKNKRSRRLTKSAKLILMGNLKAYRNKFRLACEEDKLIPKMEIANLQFWYDYIQNHKRIKEKIGKHRQAPIKVWKKPRNCTKYHG